MRRPDVPNLDWRRTRSGHPGPRRVAPDDPRDGARVMKCRPRIRCSGLPCAGPRGTRRTVTRRSVAKDDLIDVQGTVMAVHSGGLYRVQCDAGHEVLAQLSGRMRRFRIKVVPGDRVTVGVSPYDPVRGIITFRAR